MPRGRKPGSKPKSIDEQIAEVAAQIEKETALIDDLKRKKKELEKKKKEADLDEIQRAMIEHGISAHQVLEMIAQSEPQA